MYLYFFVYIIIFFIVLDVHIRTFSQGVFMRKDSMKKNNDILYSFDIFDTLITRRLADPCGIFTIMQYKLKEIENLSDFVKINFFTIRKEAESFCRFSQMIIHNTSEIKFDDIYDVIQYNYLISDSVIDNLKKLEIQTEIDNLIPIEKNINLLKKLVAANKKVVLISDMYHSSETLRKILSGIDPVFKKIPIYVSCEYAASKSDGKIFKIVKQEQLILYHNWVHFGDNQKADIDNPRQLGIKTKYLKPHDLMPCERFLLNRRFTNMAIQSIIGASKLARLYKPDIKNNDVYDFGASFAGPILYNFVDWVINFALAKKVNTLYFIARDGYIPKLIADLIIKTKRLNIKTKYLYGSRKAWRIPDEKMYEEFIDAVFLEEYSNKININFLSYRFGIDQDILKNILNISSSKRILRRKEREQIAEKLKTSTELKGKIIELLKTKKQLVKEYLKQEIDLSQKDIVFVDLHGSGKTQDYISSDLNEITNCNVYSLYLTNCLGKQKEKSKKMSYFSTLDYMSYWIELLARCPQGQTIGYEKTNDGIKPVIENINPAGLLKWGFESYVEGIKAFCKYILDSESINGLSFNSIDLYCEYYVYFTQNLDYKTASIVGDIPYLSIGNEEKTSKCAPPLTLIESVFNFIFCRKQQSVNEFQYISIARSTGLSRKFQKFIAKYPTLQKFCFDVQYRKKKQIAYIRLLGIKISLKKLFFKKGR